MIGRKTILSFSVNLLKNAIGYVALFFIARRMGAEAFGALSYGFAYVGLFHFISDMGFGVAHIKKLSEGRDLPGCIGTYLMVRTGMTLLMALAVLGSLLFHRLLFHAPLESATHEWVILLAMGTFVVLDLAQVPAGTFASRTETARQTLPDLAGKLLETGLKIAVALTGAGVVLLAGASLAGALAALALYAWLFRRYPVGRPSWSMAREYLLFALPVMVIVSANAVTEHLDQIMIQHYWKSGELGYYAGAAKITTLLMFTGTAVGTLVFPTVSALHSGKDQEGIRQITHRAERFTSLLLFPLGVLLVFNRALLIRLLLGEDFHKSEQVLVFLTAAAIAGVLSVPYYTQIIGVSRVRLSAGLSVLFMALNVALNAVFIPERIGPVALMGLGAAGAALATLLATALMGGLYRLIAWRVTATPLNPSLVRHMLATAAMGAAMAGMARLGGQSPWADAGISAAGIGVYAAALLALGERLRDDAAYLWRAVSPWKMGAYIKGEFRATPAPAEEQT